MGRRVLAGFVLAAGFLVSILGVTAVWLYVSEGVIASLGRPDRSYIFWLIPVAIIGVTSIGVGILMIWGGNRLWRNSKPGDNSADPGTAS